MHHCLPCQAYSDSDPEKKKSLIARYKAEGGIKNLAWVLTYQEESKDQEITDHEVKKGYMYASEILTLNGFLGKPVRWQDPRGSGQGSSSGLLPILWH